MVETRRNHLLRNSGRRSHPGVGQSIYLNRIAARKRSGHLRRRRWSFPGNSLRLRRREFFRILPRSLDGPADVDCLLLQHHGPGRSRNHAGSGSLRFRIGRLWFPRHGSRHHRCRFLWSGYRQCAIGLRTVADRAGPKRRSRNQKRLQSPRKL